MIVSVSVGVGGAVVQLSPIGNGVKKANEGRSGKQRAVVIQKRKEKEERGT
jgi:hypothetical protein